MVLVYVDDILVTGDNADEIQNVITLLKDIFKLKHIGKVQYFLGIEVQHVESGFILSQHKYLMELLHKTKMADCTPCNSPIAVNTKISNLDGDRLDDPFLFRSTVGALQYLTLTRPDIAYSVNKLSQYMHSPSTSHWSICKRLLQFLKGTSTAGLLFTASSSTCHEAYADADWAGCLDGRRSTGGHCVYFGTNLITWHSGKQGVVSRSSAEAEYRSIADASADLIWLQSLCKEIGVNTHTPSQLWCDNTSAITLSANPVFHARTKHIEVDVHFVREKVASRILEVGHVSRNEQVADIFTKPLTESQFHKL